MWVRVVSACTALPMTYGPFQQNDAAEFLMLLLAHSTRIRIELLTTA